MNGHHLILGELRDYLTGEPLADTHDERYRQKIMRLLVEQKHYPPSSLTPRYPLAIRAGGQSAQVLVTLFAKLLQRVVLLVQYGPGSLTTRQRPALAMSRLLFPYQVPLVVVTNGEQADVLDGFSGRCIVSSLDKIPAYEQLERLTATTTWSPIDDHRAKMEARIVFAFEVNDRCPCDDTLCRTVPST